MKKRLLAIILSTILTSVIFSGCGNDNTSTATPDEVQTVTKVAASEQSSTNATELTTEKATSSTSNNSSSSTISNETNSKSSSNSNKTNSSTNGGNNNTNNNINNNINNNKTIVKNNNTNNNNYANNSNGNTNNNNNSGGNIQSNKPSAVAVSSVSLSKSSMSVTVGSSNSFSVSFNPSNATNQSYTASTNNGNATVSCSGSTVTVYGQYAGSCTVTVTSNNGKTAICKVTISNSKDVQARVIAQEIADASYKIAHKKNSNPSDLELVSIACELVSEYCKACTYTTSDSDYSTAYGVFIKRVYTCAGSVRALGMVLDCMGYSWKHVNENQWTHQWCELTMDGKKGWADAYNGYNFGELAIGAGYGDYDSSAGDDVFEHFGWYKTLDNSGSKKSSKIVYKLTTWKAYYGLGDEELIEYYDSNGNYIKKQKKINGNLCFEYNVTTGKVTYFKSTVDFL